MVGTWAVSFVLGGLRLPALLDFTGLGMTTPLAVLTPLVVGLALLTRAIISAEVAPLVPVGLCVLSLVMGNRPGGRPHLWAWPIELDLAPWATVAAVVAFGAGLASVTLGDGGLLRAVRRAVAGGYPQTSRSFSASDTPVS